MNSVNYCFLSLPITLLYLWNCNKLTRGQCYKTFFVRNLQIFVLSLSVCTWQAFPADSNKHSSLVQKFVNYGQNMFYNIGPSLLSCRINYNRKKFCSTGPWNPIKKITNKISHCFWRFRKVTESE